MCERSSAQCAAAGITNGEKALDWGCNYYKEVNGEDKDMHGAHMIFTRNFYNVHLSHIELFDVGQPRLARYPIHWHHAHYVGAKGKYDDPSSVESLRKASYSENALATYAELIRSVPMIRILLFFF